MIEASVTPLPQEAMPKAGPDAPSSCDCDGKGGCWSCSNCPECDGNMDCDACGGRQYCVTCENAIMDDNRAEGVDTDECHPCLNRPRSAAPAPGDAPLPAPGLQADTFADADAFQALVKDWSMDQLYTAGNMLMAEGDRRGALELTEILKWLLLPDPDADAAVPDAVEVPLEPSDARVVKVEFVTDSPYEDGVFWVSEEVYLHHANGYVSRSPIELPEVDEDPSRSEWEAKLDRYEDLLADYARANPPNEGDHLIVDLATGEFEQSGRWT